MSQQIRSGGYLSTTELKRLEDVVSRNGALFYGQVWMIPRDNLQKLFQDKSPPLSSTWVETLEFLSINRKFAASSDSTTSSNSPCGTMKAARFVDSGAPSP